MFSCSMSCECIDETYNEHCVFDVDRPIALVDSRLGMKVDAWRHTMNQ